MAPTSNAKFRLYWATQPPPARLTAEHLSRLIPVDFSTEEDAIHAAALLLRAHDFVWRIERPDGRSLEALEISELCAPLLDVLSALSRHRADNSN